MCPSLESDPLLGFTLCAITDVKLLSGTSFFRLSMRAAANGFRTRRMQSDA